MDVSNLRVFILLGFAAITFVQGQTDDKYNDENRPYKFAFNIEGYQHRSEEKDEIGIIMGEFGFVTGDGVYHVTVYATDENGDFRILKTKNYYIGLPGEGTTPVPVVSTLPQPQLVPSTISSTSTTSKSIILKHLEGLKGCGGCLIPTQSSGGPTVNNNVVSEVITDAPPSTVLSKGIYNTIGTQPGSDITTHGQGVNKYVIEKTSSLQGISPIVEQMMSYLNNKTSETSYNNELPPGMTMKDLMNLLYKFNYTLRYHGHHESGYRNGDKVGDYFFNGRDGFGRRVEYLANEFGYQPNITLIDLGKDHKDTPKKETEKELNTLKGYEFKWFYRR